MLNNRDHNIFSNMLFICAAILMTAAIVVSALYVTSSVIVGIDRQDVVDAGRQIVQLFRDIME